MAVYRIFPEKDTFIFSEVQTGNAGKDEIVEIAGYPDFSGTGRTSRVLVQYSSDEIADVVTNRIGNNNYSASINLYLADASDLPLGYKLYAYPVSTTWDNGVGKFGDSPTNTTGVSWQYRSIGSTNAWLSSGFPTGVTASFYTASQGVGGNWYTGSAGTNLEFTQSHGLTSTHDVNINVTSAVKLHNSGSIVNNGFIIKLQDDLEFYTSASIRLKYYGANTNTIYPPYMEFKWDDTSYTTGSLSVLNTSIATIGIANNRGTYSDVGKQRFRLTAKPKYPARTFSISSVYLVNYALPSGSYWGLRDENTQEMIVDYDSQFTKISCDSTGPYFDVYMDGLQPERYYRILVKTTLDGSTTVLDNNNVFKVIRNG